MIDVKLVHVRFERRFNSDTPRLVAFCSLERASDGQRLITDRPLSELLLVAKQNQHAIVNAQEILEMLVVYNGFAA